MAWGTSPRERIFSTTASTCASVALGFITTSMRRSASWKGGARIHPAAPPSNNRDSPGFPGFLAWWRPLYNRPVRDRRWDHLYDAEKQPTREVILARFAEELADRLRSWPPARVEWVSEELRARHAAGLAAPPRDEVLRLGLELARLDLLREQEAFDEAMRNRAPLLCRDPGEASALQLLVLYVEEECLSLKEWAEGARLTRPDLAHALDLVERRLFRVTLA
jgi:hypothetical protein